MKNIRKIVTTALLVLLAHTLVLGQGMQKKVVLKWQGVDAIQGINGEKIMALYADGLTYNPKKGFTPEYFEMFSLPVDVGSCDILVTHTEWEPLTEDQIQNLTFPLQPTQTLSPIVETAMERGVNKAMLTLIPVVVNPEGGIMRLKSFTIDVVYLPVLTQTKAAKSENAVTHSVLAQGSWYKVKLNKTGIYKITYAEMQAMGVDMTKVSPGKIRVYGNGGGMLPEANSVFRYDDLNENPIQVVTANPNVFVQGDYILFYGTSPHKILYNKVTRRFEHEYNVYSDFTYYFLNFDTDGGLRIDNQVPTTMQPTYTSTSFYESVFYEKDLTNITGSGKDFLGEGVKLESLGFEIPEFTFSNIKPFSNCWLRYRVAARSGGVTNFTIKINSKTIATSSVNPYTDYDFAFDNINSVSFYPESDKVKISLQNNRADSDGWLDWIELNISRLLKFSGGQMLFADPSSVFPGSATEFQMEGSSLGVTIWEVTNPVNVKRIVADLQNGVSKFTVKTDSLRQFIAWDNTSFLATQFVEKVKNQDLHGIESADMLIVTHKDYLDQANRLASHHRSADGLKVIVAENEQIYNEFSSGSPDIAAIRDFARMLYNRGNGIKLQYLLLFGDGSYDFKDRVANNTNRVLTFQTKESLNTVASYASDDFFGLLDSGEGNDGYGLLDIGIGRFPVNNVEQAKVAVDKCIFYATNSSKSLGDWRNKLCFVADDGNSNLHFSQVEKDISPLIEKIAPVYNINKIYIDAYKQISTPTGQECPDVTAAINTNIKNGVLVMNYTGHGGETSWAQEGILSIADINAWTNYNNMPVFVTATCEFSRYDNPKLFSAGEQVFLNPQGGGIALFTTTRLASSAANIALTLSFYDTLFSKFNGEYPRFGNVIANAKNRLGLYNAPFIRNFVLLGDPALQLAYPKNNVVTTFINGRPSSSKQDTIRAMSPVEIKGIVTDGTGNKLTNFSGVIDVKVFDKPRTLTTLGTDVGDYPDTYTLQDNYIYQGRSTVKNGDFTTSFIVPRDINYSYGFGKISYYAQSGNTDANGFSNKILIGGSEKDNVDNVGPQINLFMDGLEFKNGGKTGENPTLIAKLNDESGINTVSNGIGHDIVATIDGDNTTSMVLNSFYSADIDSYRSGVVKYRFAKLSVGIHTLTLKAWDVFNNSSEATITFEVTNDIQLSITKINAFPNPFREGLSVDFEINLFDAPVEAYLEVFNINGALISNTETKLSLSDGHTSGRLTWDGRSGSGAKITPGVYLVAVRAKSGKSETVKATKVLKLK